MRQVVLNVAVTLDGFIEGPHGEIDWCQTEDLSASGAESHFDKFLAGIDTIFYGRVSYDLWGNYQPQPDASEAERKLWSNVNAKKKYVFSRKPPSVKQNAEYVDRNIAEVVSNLKNQAGKDLWLYGGAQLITTFINLDLVDRYLLAVHPVILGGGKPLFTDLQHRTKLQLNKVESWKTGVMLVDYSTIRL